MNSKQEARLGMIHKTVEQMNYHKAKWENDPIFPGVMETINIGIKDINLTLRTQEKQTQEYTEHKMLLRNRINDFLASLFAAIRAFAKLTNNDILFRKYQISLTKIRRFSDTEIIPFFDEHMAYATAHIADLEPYGIREAGLKSAQADMDEYQDTFKSPEAIKAIRATATAKLQEQLNGTVSIFDDVLDNLMEQFHTSDPDFYNDYHNARIIYDNPTHHKALHGIVTDEETKEVLEHVKVTFIHDSDAAEPDAKYPTTFTTEKGYYEFKSLPEGAGTVMFEMPYYVTLHMQVNLLPNKDYQLNVAIRKKE